MQHTIAIVDDHILIAEALAGSIEHISNYEVLFQAANGKVLMEKFKTPQHIPDIVLLDINMPEMDGFETAKWLTKNHPEVLILALSMQDDEQTLIKMLRCGANGYLLKSAHPKELEKALNAIVTNGYYYPEWVTGKIIRSISAFTEEETPLVDISKREKEFLQYVASELTYKEIAEKMFCSPRTVESYSDSLFEKLTLKTRIGLALYAIKSGFIKL